MSKNYPIKEEFQKVYFNFTKAILLYKPKDIIDFAISYFTSLEKKIPLEQILNNQKNLNTSKNDSTLYNEQNIEDEKNKNSDDTNSYYNFEDNDSKESNDKIPLTKDLEELIINKDIGNKNKIVKNDIKEEIPKNDSQINTVKDFISELFNL
jgi:hypothetical protein